MRKHEIRTLDVYLGESRIGALGIDDHGIFSFRYDPDADGWLSISMPPREEAYSGRHVKAWFDGLLPDREITRRSMAAGKAYGYGSTFGLLADYGRDLPGSIALVPEGTSPDTADAIPEESLSEEEIGRRLKRMIDGAELLGSVGWHDKREKWSLGGAQPKVALRKTPDGYWKSTGRTASNVILKTGVPNMELQVYVEHASLEIARRIGLPAVKSSIEEFGGIPALVVERYDRMTSPDGRVVARSHQEDLCQALGIEPGRKYLEGGNPTKRALDFLDEEMPAPQEKGLFIDSVMFNYLIGATDGHLKNYSIVHGPGKTFALAPLYDVASYLPYWHADEGCTVALPIGRERRIGKAGKHALGQLAEHAHASPQAVIGRFVEMSERIIGCAPDVIDSIGDEGARERLSQTFGRRLDRHCRNAVRNVASGRKYVTLDLYRTNGGKSLSESSKAAPRANPSPPGGDAGKYPSPEELKPTARGFEYRTDSGDAAIAFDDHEDAGWSATARQRSGPEIVVYGNDFEEVYRKTRERIDATRISQGLDPLTGPNRPASTEAIETLIAERDRLIGRAPQGAADAPPRTEGAPSRSGQGRARGTNATKPRTNSSRKN
jgi:serine/threonine-protein kinase HipA